ncbi:hypothetical protein M408DRAFT_27851 [Serendipita vermifera MAFF 305830]|uniref:Actin-like ATPase domain-containing protein n=1 Tax=Serendipita vermifera MAFF 305830 TaxID=933852 RepID=A0A0C2WAQ7_SERVB|nr:hypothetical protein M408DRAFT_27851 [Serendipita vermifera MAFF 305830]
MADFSSNKPYEGSESIAIAMDIGTTNSAVAFTYLHPGSRPKVQAVTRWSCQPLLGHESKTPSAVLYEAGEPKAYGTAAMEALQEHPERVAYWFKLHLHPPTSLRSAASQRFEIPPLPVGVTIERVYTDLMRYLMKETQHFFERTIQDGQRVWARVRDNIVIVLATPNGWDIREQAVLRRAAIKASLVTEETADPLLQFVTESEASVHYALAYPKNHWLERNTIFAVVDCGGSTIDTTIYRCVSTDPLSLKETYPSECIQAGGIFVDREVEKMLKKKFHGTSFSEPESIRSTVKIFENQLKPIFDGILGEYSLQLGSTRENDPGLGICKGKIILSNQDLKPAFDLVAEQIINNTLTSLIKRHPEYIILAGGFAESPYVQRVFQRTLANSDIEIISGGDFVNKAAAEGAVIAHIKQFVVARAAKATFGGCVRAQYEKKLHRERKHTVKVYADGKPRVDNAFHAWITKGTILQGTSAHKLPYHVAWDAASTSINDISYHLGAIGIEVFAWEGDDIPKWCKDKEGGLMKGMRLICTLHANLSALAEGLQIQRGPRGTKFYRVDYDVYVSFGGTQLHAKIQWKEKGVLREGPVTVMPYVS